MSDGEEHVVRSIEFETRDCASRMECGVEPWERMSSNMWFMARWLAVPASQTRWWRGRDSMGKTGKEDKWKAGHREETWILPCSV